MAALPLSARTWRNTAILSGAFTLIVALTMLLSYQRSVADDPLKANELQLLREQLRQKPNDDVLKRQIREADLAQRQIYFTHARRSRSGAMLLLAGGLIALLAYTRLLVLRSQPPVPCPLPAWKQVQRDSRQALLAIAATAGALLVIIAVLSLHRSYRARPADGQTVLAGEPNVSTGWVASPRFRGLDGSGVSALTNIPAIWNIATRENVAWISPVPMGGNSSPVIVGDRVFLTGAERNERAMFCFSTASGELLWRLPLALAANEGEEKAEPGLAGKASSTVAADDQRVYAIFATGELIAADHSGRLVWSKYFGKLENPYGHAASLVLWRKNLLVQIDQGRAEAGKSRLYAFDGATGKMVWEQRRMVASSWATPLVVNAGGMDQIIALGEPWLISYNATDGRELWRFGDFGSELTPSPIFAAGFIVAVSPNKRLVAIRPGGSGDVTKSHLAWSLEEHVPDIASPVSNGELLFTLESNGTITCLEAATGKTLWEHSYDGEFHSSPAIIDDRLLAISTEGHAITIHAGREFRELAQGTFGEPVHASPAFVDGKMLVRGATNLFCIAATAVKGGAR